MKYKIIGISVTALVLITVLCISFIMPEDNGARYIEHIMAEEKGWLVRTILLLYSVVLRRFRLSFVASKLTFRRN